MILPTPPLVAEDPDDDGDAVCKNGAPDFRYISPLLLFIITIITIIIKLRVTLIFRRVVYECILLHKKSNIIHNSRQLVPPSPSSRRVFYSQFLFHRYTVRYVYIIFIILFYTYIYTVRCNISFLKFFFLFLLFLRRLKLLTAARNSSYISV